MGLFNNLRGLMGDVGRRSASKGADSAPSTQTETERHLEQHGVATTAVVQDARPTAMRFNENPVVEVDLLVRRREGNVPLTVNQAVHEVHLARLAPGSEVAVLADPHDSAIAQLRFE